MNDKIGEVVKGQAVKAVKAIIDYRGVINGKAGKAAALPKFSDTLTLSQPGEADYAHSLALPHRKNFSDYAPEYKHVISVS